MQITPVYAALLALVYIGLSVRAIRLRRRLKIGIGDGGNPQMLRAMRVHANFAEYAPLAIVLIYMLEASGGHALLVQALCACLLAGRLLHAFGVSRLAENVRIRVAGMVLTFTALGGAAVSLLAWKIYLLIT
jgi:uncharacterized membrane protein YecN with MAPEG domain